MNKEIEKAMSRKENSFHRFAKWYHKNGYKINRIVLFPIWIAIVIKGKVNSYLRSRVIWDEKRADEILNYYVPRKANWDAQENEFYFFDNGTGWDMKHNLRKIKLKDRRFWKKFTVAWGGEIRKYLIDKFELEGFTKEIGYVEGFETEISFVLK